MAVVLRGRKEKSAKAQRQTERGCESAGTSAAHAVGMLPVPAHPRMNPLTSPPQPVAHVCMWRILTHFLIGAAAGALWEVCFHPSVYSALCHLSSETSLVLFDYESYAATKLVICFQISVSSQLVWSTTGDQMAACGLWVIGNGPVLLDLRRLVVRF